MPFANLMGLLASGTDSTAALRCIQQVSLLVQGNWVVKRWEKTSLKEFNRLKVFFKSLIGLCSRQREDACVLRHFIMFSLNSRTGQQSDVSVCFCFFLQWCPVSQKHLQSPQWRPCRSALSWPRLCGELLLLIAQSYTNKRAQPLECVVLKSSWLGCFFCRCGGSLWSALWWGRRLQPSSK